MGMKNIIYNMNPYDNELFTIGMRNVVLHTAPPSLLGSLVTILSLYLKQPINEATHTLADLGEVETIRKWKEVQATTERRGAKGLVNVSRTQMWVDLVKAGIVKEKLDGQPNKMMS